MRLVKRVLIFLIVLYIGVIVFMPKKQLYYFAEKSLNDKYGVVISNEDISSTPLSLNINHALIFAQGLQVARVANAKVLPLLFVNKVELEDIELANMAKQFINVSISSLRAKESILNPYIIDIDAVGNFGIIKGYANLKSRVLHLDLVEVKDANSLKKFFKKGKKGWFYESKF